MGTGGFSPSHLFTFDITFLFSYYGNGTIHTFNPQDTDVCSLELGISQGNRYRGRIAVQRSGLSVQGQGKGSI